MNRIINNVIIILLSFITLIACSKSTNPALPVIETALVGNWINPVYKGDTVVYEKSVALINNQHGISIKDDGKIIERKNSSWCGTPPITCSDYEGTWQLSDSLLTINGTFWGGKMIEKYKVIKLTNMDIMLKRISSDYSQLTK